MLPIACAVDSLVSATVAFHSLSSIKEHDFNNKQLKEEHTHP